MPTDGKQGQHQTNLVFDAGSGLYTPRQYAGSSLPQRPNFVNAGTGLGTPSDKSYGAAFQPILMDRSALEILHRYSWAARKAIDIPVDDAWVRGRRFTGDDEGAIAAMDEAVDDLNSDSAVAEAMRAGRIFGSALLIIVPTSGSIEGPMYPAKIKEGGVANLYIVEHYQVEIYTMQTDRRKPGFGRPYQYKVQPRWGEPEWIVHKDWVLRFDGRRSPLSEGWVVGPERRDWGMSELVTIVNEVHRDEANHVGIAHLIQEASIFVMKMAGFKDAIKGRQDKGEPTIQELASETNMAKSMYRTMFVDREDEAERVNPSFGGLPDLVDRLADRIAAAADIPRTRFFGVSPAGMNATGDSDAQNYAIHVKSNQKKHLTKPLKKLDKVLQAHAGIPEKKSDESDTFEYEWIPLMDLSDADKAEATKSLTESVVAAYAGGLIDEDEARERLSQDEFWGELGEWTPSAMTEHEMENEEKQFEQSEKALAEKANGKGNGAGNPAKTT